jgi:hypothetical protein
MYPPVIQDYPFGAIYAVLDTLSGWMMGNGLYLRVLVVI